MTATALKVIETIKSLSRAEQDEILETLLLDNRGTGLIPDEVSDELAEELFLQMDQDEMNHGKN